MPIVRVQDSQDFLDKGLIQRSRTLMRSANSGYLESVLFDREQQHKGAIFRDRDMPDRAIQILTLHHRNHRLSPFAASAALEAGFIELERRSFAEAVPHFERSVNIVENDLVHRNDSVSGATALLAHYWLGAAYAALGKDNEACDVWRRCSKYSSTDELAARARFAAAQILERQNDDSSSLDEYAQVMLAFPRSQYATESQVRRAVIFMQKRNPARALDELQGIEQRLADCHVDGQVLRCAVLSEYASIIRVQAYAMQNLTRKCVDSGMAFLQRYPASSNRYYIQLSMGFSYLQSQLQDSALQQYDSIVASDLPEESLIRQQALLYRGICLQRLNRLAESEQLFTALSLQVGYTYKPHALIEVGQALYQREEYEKAYKALERAERETTDAALIAKARILMGSAMVQRQQWDRAASSFEKAVSLCELQSIVQVPLRDAYLAQARLQKGISLAQSNQHTAAIAALTDFLGNHPNDLRRDEATFWLAEVMYRENLLKNAQELYEEIIRRYTASPRREEAMYGLAWTFFRKRDFIKSSKAFEELISTFPQSRYTVEAMIRRADGLYVSHQFKAASVQYEQAAQRGGSTEEGQYAAFQAGNAAYKGGDVQRAASLMRQFAVRFSKSRLADDALYLIGWILFQQQNDAEAIRELEQLLASYPDGDHAVRALYTIGDAQYNLGEYESSIRTYRRVMTAYPSHPLAAASAKSLQEVLVSQGRTDEAVAVLDTLIGLNPESSAAEDYTWSKAQIFYSGKNYSTAASELSAYLQKYPTAQRKDEALYLLGKTYLGMHDLPQALASFKEIERSYKNSSYIVSSRMDLAYYYAENANVSSCDSIYRIVLREHSEDSLAASTAGYELAEHARMKGDTASALVMYRQTADQYPTEVDGVQARYKLAQLYRKSGSMDSARYHYQILSQLKDQPSVVANVLYDLGTTYFRERNYNSAAESFVRVREEYAGVEDWYTLSMLALGECFEQLQQKQDAIDAYQTVADLRPDDDYGKTAVARVKRLKGQRK